MTAAGTWRGPVFPVYRHLAQALEAEAEDRRRWIAGLAEKWRLVLSGPRFDPAECAGCMAFAGSNPHLVGACASVGIERGKSTGQMLREYLTGYHQRGHAGG